MKIGSLVRITKSADERLVGSLAIIVDVSTFNENAFVIKRFRDGRKQEYHHTRLEVICK